MPPTVADAFELLAQAELLEPRLAAAAAALAQLPGLDDEQAWLAAAQARLAGARLAAHGDLLDRALRLPEIDGKKRDRGKLLQGALADEVERLQGGIVHVGGARPPLLDVLFHNLKMPALRKCGAAELERCCVELERRLTSSYAQRMLTSDTYVALTPTIATLARAIATWRGVFVDPPLADPAAAPLRAELIAAAAAVELPLRQARLLAQAALLPAAELLDAAGVLTAKARRRGKDLDDDTHPLLERDPPDPRLPTAAEQAELGALDAG
jgi:hypothetical protein